MGVCALFFAIAAADKAVSAASSPIDPSGVWHWIWIGGITVAFVAYVFGVVRTHRRPGVPLGAVLAVAVVMQLAPLTGPLLLSTDAFAYWDYGRLAAVHHVNPYATEPSQVLQPTDLGYGEGLGTAIYGPAFTAASEVHARAVGTSARAAEVSYRVAAAVGVIALLLIVAFFARRPAHAVALVGWNPLFALHFAGGGHNDIWMLLPVVGGILLMRNARPVASGVGWAASAFVKASAIALLPLELIATLRRDRGAARRLCTAFAGAAICFAAFATLLYGTAWPSFIHRASIQLSQTSSLSLVFRLGQLGVSRQLAKALLAAVFVLGYLKLLVDAWRTGKARLAFAATLLIFTPAWLVPWYGSWPVALAATEDDRTGEALALVATAYLLTDALPLPYI